MVAWSELTVATDETPARVRAAVWGGAVQCVRVEERRPARRQLAIDRLQPRRLRQLHSLRVRSGLAVDGGVVEPPKLVAALDDLRGKL